ncbi:MAG TPA: methyltransferase domain-containing protein [Cyclobacteriaceae bacterium]|jgi:SAM-dependent methyltransferase|nr:methyltransferase domain-containing protein [Cyclobacteriaceae bacterium]
MIFELLKLNVNVTDDDFNGIYPKKIRLNAQKHWTPVSVAKSASEFLVDRPGTRVLDIGSGVGKFCMVGACNTKGYFTGIEQRLELVELSKKISRLYQIRNVEFFNGNIIDIKFNYYDAFYFYNSFYENIDMVHRIDDTIKLDTQLYHSYCLYIVDQFRSLPLGTRLVTFCSPLNIIPQSFKLQDSINGGLLKFWEKVDI